MTSASYQPYREISTPAAMAEPMTPATLGPMACISRKLPGLYFWPTIKESAFGFMYLLAKEVGTFDHPFLNGVMPKLPYPHELCCAGVWHSTEEKINVLKALGFHDFDFYQTLLKNPMYTNEDVEDVVPGYQSGGYVAIIAHK